MPTAALPGEQPAATQHFPVAPPPFSRQQLTRDDLTTRTPAAHAAALALFEQYGTAHPFEAPSLRGSILFPGVDGGGEWGGPAFDPTSGLLYVNANEMAWLLKLVPRSDRSLYAANCASCHGDDRTGSAMAPSLVDIATRRSREQIAQVIREGTGRMPAFASALEGRAITDIVNYLVTGRDASAVVGPDPFGIPYRNAYFDIFLDPDGYPAITPPWGTLSAIDLNAGTIRWQIPLGEYPKLAAQGIRNTGHRQLRRRDRHEFRAALHRRDDVRQHHSRVRQAHRNAVVACAAARRRQRDAVHLHGERRAVPGDRVRRRQERRAERWDVRGVRAGRPAGGDATRPRARQPPRLTPGRSTRAGVCRVPPRLLAAPRSSAAMRGSRSSRRRTRRDHRHGRIGRDCGRRRRGRRADGTRVAARARTGDLAKRHRSSRRAVPAPTIPRRDAQEHTAEGSQPDRPEQPLADRHPERRPEEQHQADAQETVAATIMAAPPGDAPYHPGRIGPSTAAHRPDEQRHATGELRHGEAHRATAVAAGRRIGAQFGAPLLALVHHAAMPRRTSDTVKPAAASRPASRRVCRARVTSTPTEHHHGQKAGRGCCSRPPANCTISRADRAPPVTSDGACQLARQRAGWRAGSPARPAAPHRSIPPAPRPSQTDVGVLGGTALDRVGQRGRQVGAQRAKRRQRFRELPRQLLAGGAAAHRRPPRRARRTR